MLLLVYALVEGARRRLGRDAGRSASWPAPGVLLAAFVVNERAPPQPAVPVVDLAHQGPRRRRRHAADRDRRLLRDVLLPHPLHAERPRLLARSRPARRTCRSRSASASQPASPPSCSRASGTRPIIVAGALISAGGVYWLSRIPVHGSYLADLLPALVIMSFGLGAVFVGVTTAANAGVPPDKAGLAAALVNASQQLGGALGLAIFSAIATSRANDLLAATSRGPRRSPRASSERSSPAASSCSPPPSSACAPPTPAANPPR